MNIFQKYIVLILGILLISACSKNSTGIENPPPSGIERFPDDVGQTWVYAVQDSLTASTDTVTVRITARWRLNNGESAAVWVRTSPTTVDTLLVSVVDDTVKIYENPVVPRQIITIVFPLSVGNSWPGVNQLQEFTIAAKESVTIPGAGEFSSFRIHEQYGNLNDYLRRDLWICEDVGIVRMYVNRFGFSFEKKLWTLLAFGMNL